MNLNTQAGMAEAVAWCNRHIANLNDGGTWYIPRSGTTVKIDRASKTATIRGTEPDYSVGQVLRACGWTTIETFPGINLPLPAIIVSRD